MFWGKNLTLNETFSLESDKNLLNEVLNLTNVSLLHNKEDNNQYFLNIIHNNETFQLCCLDNKKDTANLSLTFKVEKGLKLLLKSNNKNNNNKAIVSITGFIENFNDEDENEIENIKEKNKNENENVKNKNDNKKENDNKKVENDNKKVENEDENEENEDDENDEINESLMDDDNDSEDDVKKDDENKEKVEKKDEKKEKDDDDDLLEEDEDDDEEEESEKNVDNLLNKKTQRPKDTSSSEDESDGYNSDEKAEIRAIAKKMLRKKERLKILNSSYNRYAFEDDGKVPKWFLEDESKHNKPQKPITKAEVLAEKEYLKKITVRMPKKVLEAKARKRNKLNKRLQKIRKQAEGIANQDEYTEISKVKQIEKLYKREINKSKEKKRYIISRSWSNNKGKDSRNVRHVDRRMKKDKRAVNAREKRNKKYKRRR
jgi:AdoMet-dependent rRNA methyltransferase SPB1